MPTYRQHPSFVTNRVGWYQTFVSNRIAEVQRLTEGHPWNHVPGLDNPADIISRGISSSDLFRTTLWWKGPPWLTSEADEWPSMSIPCHPVSTDILEEKSIEKTAAIAHQLLVDQTLFQRYSSLTKLVRIAAWCRRFVQQCKSKNQGKPLNSTRYITAEEFHQALMGLVQVVQRKNFSSEISSICAGRSADLKRSSLRRLNPFFQDGILRVGGRLSHSLHTFEKKHPVVPPADHPFTALLIASAHKQLLHAGPRLMMAHIRERFWPLNLRNLARKVVRTCIQCFRTKPELQQQLMGQLPSVRVTQSRAFLNTGVDFRGPIHLKPPGRRSRASPLIKSYIALFVCMTTKAIHIEMVSDLTTEGFIAALKRFVARRGRPRTIFCDNTTNFTGAEKELKTLLRQFNDQQHQHTVTSLCAEIGIQFNFIPARAPTFGGLWEAAVKSLKHHLRRVVGLKALTAEAMQTVLTQIESCLNSRPLTALSEDPNDLVVLIPGHFLVGSALQSIPEPDLAEVPVNRLSLWQAM
ncbi:uncharacterized protein LOC129779234 isoform X1 [Toxorhynchites rutilus septentrionalis]|uniref:uncharacterized protein LOC129779234 isoform X1 n=2 Tax=Toxorhynchites rutilus septentrionalis TaxID=329112 RepID=UPI002478DFE4|nr:uncharacterized protein LOC129779234 isoform X1 [Toxorhynchites rutilus septentrionalis]